MSRFSLSPEIEYGTGALGVLTTLPCKKVLIVTDAFMVTSGIISLVTKHLDQSKIEWSVYDQVEPNPSIRTVAQILGQYLLNEPDGVIALGGGSPIDAAKGVLYTVSKMKERLSESSIVKRPYFVAIPTTSGTGSEVTSYSVLTDEVAETKIALAEESMLPHLAILDPVFTKTLPKSIIADTGMDVLTHATEAFVSKVRNSYANALAKEAVTEVFKHLVANYNDPARDLPREAMQNASCMAGIAFNNSSLGINHSLAHGLGGKFHIPHGKINAILMPYVIRFNSGIGLQKTGEDLKTPSREHLMVQSCYSELARAIGLPSGEPLEGTKSYLLGVEYLLETLNIPKSLKELGIEEPPFLNALESLAAQCHQDICTPNNPIAVTIEDLKALLMAVYYGN